MIASGTGLYTLRETARYARMHPQTVSRWFKGDDYCRKVFLLDNSKIITFLDFVQVLAVRNVRIQCPEVSLQKIRDALKCASDQFQISYPFARRHTTFVFEKEIWILPTDGILTQASGKMSGQKGMVPVIERFLKDISFDAATGLAEKFNAFERGNNKISMNPQVRFGEPLLDGSGYTPLALFEAAKTEGSSAAAAKMYGVTQEQVEICIDYFDFLEAA
jgi:uncharacterized protein (DUF433 family)